jgi:hypothetical protein
MNKIEILSNLKNVKLIIGNGFDIHCGLHTSYKAFFDYLLKNKGDKLEQIQKITSDKSLNIETYKEIIKNINVWDFYFYLVSKEDKSIQNLQWFDIESIIANSLLEKDNPSNITYPKWKYVFIQGMNPTQNFCNPDLNTFFTNEKEKYEAKVRKLSLFYFLKNSKKEKYEWLLDELKKFEKEFGKFIDNEHRSNISTYTEAEKEFIDYLLPFFNINCIDTFNFGNFDLPTFDDLLFHINGNIEHPIFGIDSSVFKQSMPQSIFSKTNRRMELDMMFDDVSKTNKVKNLVIYGHSLTEPDYSYFFSMFDMIKLYKTSNDSKVIIAYSQYGKTSEENENIKSKLRESISKLFEEYSKYRGNINQPQRFIEHLTLQHRLFLVEIPS